MRILCGASPKRVYYMLYFSGTNPDICALQRMGVRDRSHNTTMTASTAAFQLAAATAAPRVRFPPAYAPLVPLYTQFYAEPLNENELNKHSDPTHPSDTNASVVADYVNLIRPVTLVQAVGAFVVGCLSIQRKPTLASILSIYLSYGAGMVFNDITDSSLDARQPDKKNRAIASGRITKRQGWIFSLSLSLVSCLLAITVNRSYLMWNVSNLLVMLTYALGLQNVLFVKNAIVGYLGISPLIGAVLLDTTQNGLSSVATSRLKSLASVGLPVGVAREFSKTLKTDALKPLVTDMPSPEQWPLLHN